MQAIVPATPNKPQSIIYAVDNMNMPSKPLILHKAGFTLLETMLVLALIGTMLVMAINYGARHMAQQRLEMSALQMQQILNAGLAYYTSHGTWPSTCAFASNSATNASTWSSISALSTAGYLPANLERNAFGYSYAMSCDRITGGVFYVMTQVSSHAIALALAGELPLGYTSDQYGNPSTTENYVTAQVTIPGQNLNNARSVNFSGIYHHGACVPVPNCPGYDPSASAPGCKNGRTDCMVPQIMVVPVAVSGVSDPPPSPLPSPYVPNVYPIASFTAYAYGPAGAPVDCLTGATATACTGTALQSTSASSNTPLGTGIASPNGLYWRVCLQVVTQKGVVAQTNTATGMDAWGQYASLMVITRCTPPNEPFGSDFGVYTQ